MHNQGRDVRAGLPQARSRPKPSLRAKPRPWSGRGPLARGGPRSAPRRLAVFLLRSVGFPIARIEEVMADRTQTHFGDERHHSFVVASTHALADAVHERRVKARGDQLGWTQAAIDEVVEDEVGLRVGEAE